MSEPATATVAIIFLGSLFAGFYLLARAVSTQAYRRITLGLALGPAGLWAVIGLTSNNLPLILGMAAVLAAAVFALSRLAARLAGR